MNKLHLLAAGSIAPSTGAPAVAAFVAVSFGMEGSRLFRVHGAPAALAVEELPAQTTVDVWRFRTLVERELRHAHATAAIEPTEAGPILDRVRRHLHETEGLEPD